MINKPLLFTAHIDPSLPATLIGDEIRVRQILINILSNAVKYTNEGYITMDIGGAVSGDTITLSISVADSGIGIKEDDIGRLFSNFVQIDAKKNKGVEGTGLGLAITHNLCAMMGGSISVRSEYGRGSTFTVVLPQGFSGDKPLAVVENATDSAVLLYETRELYRDAITRTLDDLHVRYRVVHSAPELFDCADGYPFAFVASFMLESVYPTLSNMDNPPDLVLMTDITETHEPGNARILALPATPLSVANILNDAHQKFFSATGASFTAPEATVLIVDDIVANLKVAEGLLQYYKVQSTLCKGGHDALKIIRKKKFDIVFMDHMMPEMDGLEVARRIREMEGEYYKTLPIIALTANAISGVREMFKEHGMNDFLAKPIEVKKLDAILSKWIPQDKQI